MFTINARTLDGRWKPELGALQGRSCKHHYHEWGSEHQAATAAVVGHPEKALEDDATQEQIEEEAKQAAFEYVHWHFEEVK